ncbi:MAG: HAMP domain-containing sensor histidine kinase [Candidatus Baltobacteraceae bacterium]
MFALIGSSLRWRIATWYALLLLVVIGAVMAVLVVQLHALLFDQARAQVDRTGNDIAGIVERSSPLPAIGDSMPIEEQLTMPGNLEHWASPTTYIQIDNGDGYPIAKSANLGAMTFGSLGTSEPLGVVTYGTVQLPFGELLLRDQRLRLPDGGAIVVRVAERLDLFNETLRRTRELLSIVFALAVVAVVAASFAIASSAIRPIGELTNAMRAISSHELDRRLGWSHRRDELGRLADTFDQMLARLEEGFARERQFISDASHELKTPLTVINANAQMLARWADSDPELRAESLRAIGEESAALARIVNGMLTLAKAASGDDIPREPLALDGVAADVVRALQAPAIAKGLILQFRGSDSPIVFADANLVRQLVTNLTENAIKFTEQGSVTLDVRASGEWAILDVADTGPGIESEARSHVFDRFYRTDKSRSRAIEGTGLGLAIVRSIARVHGGSVEALPNLPHGSIFRVTLPAMSGTKNVSAVLDAALTS